MILIVGLGNPGKKYQKTRHNVGFRVIDEFSKENNFLNWKESKKIGCLYTKNLIADKKVELIKPLIYMNNSGKVVKHIVKKHTLKSRNIIIIHDDIDLPIGKIKISKGRGSAGHKGVQSIINEIGTKKFIRFRIGIKPKTHTSNSKILNKFVLQKFNKEEEKIIKEGIKITVEAIKIVVEQGIEKAMNKFNK